MHILQPVFSTNETEQLSLLDYNFGEMCFESREL